MTDHFQLLAVPRLPWLDAEAVKANFLRLSAECHPDRVHGASEEEKRAANQRFVALNAACQCLCDPRNRLQHLLELELGAKPKTIERAPSVSMDLFLSVGRLCQQVDAFLAERAKAVSPLLKIGFFERGAEWTAQVNLLQRQISTRHEELLADLKSLNSAWEQAPPDGHPRRAEALPLSRIEAIYRELSYLTRWMAQLQERVVQLAF